MLNQTITCRGPKVGELYIGVVVPRTGRLATLGDPLPFVVDLLGPKLHQIINGRRRWEVRLACRDSCSEPGAAREAAAELINQEQAQVVVTMAGTRVLPAVADICETLDTPCVYSTFPWQAYFFGRGADSEHPFGRLTTSPGDWTIWQQFLPRCGNTSALI
jgi:branched-chain amino acid transport system substrate-binding protein